MKIVVIGPLPPYRGGISHFTQALAVELGKAGHDVLPKSFRKQYPKQPFPGINEPLGSPELTDYIVEDSNAVLIYNLKGIEICNICERLFL